MELKDVENLSELAKIELTEEEKKGLMKDLDSILGYIKQISEVDVRDIEPKNENRNVWREDILEERDFSAQIIKKQFPDSQDSFVKVKKIM